MNTKILWALASIMISITHAAVRTNKLAANNMNLTRSLHCAELQRLAERVRTAKTPTERNQYQSLHQGFCTALEQIMMQINYAQTIKQFTPDHPGINQLIAVSMLMQKTIEASIQTALMD